VISRERETWEEQGLVRVKLGIRATESDLKMRETRQGQGERDRVSMGFGLGFRVLVYGAVLFP
jgi:hypothetical protein